MATTSRNALEQYRGKRDFKKTPEPEGKSSHSPARNSFVVQKHWASHLHYDFRLEMGGVMKSWAIPKGPSFDPKIKRMAVHVEDHPISYSSFEGTIPAKQYGAGKVIVWDKGTWSAIGDAKASYEAGNLKFELLGQKLRGRWVLVRMKGRSESQEPWLLIKEKDALARSNLEFSVVDEMPDSIYTNRANELPPVNRRSAPKKVAPKKVRSNIPLPHLISPQLATLVDKAPPDPENWIFEIKFDGYRMLMRVENGQIGFFTRNGNDWTKKLLALQKEIRKQKLPDGWYDGEVVLPNAKGLPDFGALQQAFDSEATKDIVIYLFDVLFLDGQDLRQDPLTRRRERLASLLEARSSEHLRFSAEFLAPARDLMLSACQLGLEGIIGKRRDSSYSASRSQSWIKLKCSQRQEFVIGGYTDPKGARSGIGALLLGVHDSDGQLRYAGKVGTGFDAGTLRTLERKLRSRVSKAKPFAAKDAVEGKAHWVKPTLIAEVTFANWTRDGRIRHSSFHALRDDKPANEIVRERPVAMQPKAGSRKKTAPDESIFASTQKVTHPERVIDRSSGSRKIDLVRYYGLVADLMMAHLKDRPVSLVRAPSGVAGPLFFQKHAETEKLLGIITLPQSLDANHPPLLAVSSRQGLTSAAQWNVVELHTRNAVATAFDTPDRIVFDLDPGEGVSWKEMQEGARLVHSFLDQLGLNAFLKTSGGKGLHIVVPIKRTRGWAQVKTFSKAVVIHLAKVAKQRFVSISGPKNRIGKIFVDYLRNGEASTTVAAWSARARPGMGISVPVGWEELQKLTSGDQWTIANAHTRLDVGNSPWKNYAKSAVKIDKAIRLLNR